jgi:hypothetical protein
MMVFLLSSGRATHKLDGVVFGELEIDRHLAHYGDIRDSNPLLGTPYWHWQGEKIIWFVISDLEGCCLKDCDLERDLSQPYRSDYERGRRDGPAPRIQSSEQCSCAAPVGTEGDGVKCLQRMESSVILLS